MTTELLETFYAHNGLVSLIGAGGKKTTLLRLARSHPGRVGVTSTVLIPPFTKQLQAQEVVEPADRLTAAVEAAAFRSRRVAFALPAEKPKRLGGVDPAQVVEIHRRAGFDLCLVKADGARFKGIKAPGAAEPVIPESSVVIPIVSASVFGEPLSEQIAHRVDRIVTLTGAVRGDPIAPEHVARLLAAAQGALQNIGEARVIAAINMVHTAAQRRLARQAAELVLALTDRIDRIVLTRMVDDLPIVDVVDR